MSTEQICLTLVAGRKIERDLLDYLSEQSDLVSGFTVSDATGHGPAVELHSAVERVKGRASRVVVRIIIDAAAARQLIARLEATFAGARLVYWATPVSMFGVVE